ncbi:DUF3566 domain-containing protein [Kutzneria kofuensis]|uniref:DUF3566 domain-containing protein n=1 Tax=Kutzneria kofuensis TaxID=103725 RepID=A0A7W9KF28_9PSEU|nr:DUF3566 domain-containing protein [Kutzneria kofuensis]MBB5891356.1 hypothetical protein [Kutzneria kofuensis]
MRKAQPERVGATRPRPIVDGVPEQRRPEERAGKRRDDVAETTALPAVSAPVVPDNIPDEPRRRRSRGQRRATFNVDRISSWSMFRLAIAIGAALFVPWMIGLVTLYAVLQRAGVWDRLNGTLNDLVRGGGHDVGNVINFGSVLLAGAAVGLLTIVLFAGFVGACVLAYNYCSELAGGVELTLAEPRVDDTAARS